MSIRERPLKRNFCVLLKNEFVILYNIPTCKWKKLVIYYSQKG